VLGTSVLRRIGRTVGQMITVTVNGHSRHDRIVGRAVFPNFGQGSFTPTDLGPRSRDHSSSPPAASVLSRRGPHYDFVLLRFAPGPHGPPTSPASSGRWPVSAEQSSRPPAW
jgi:hypothetical protein